MKNLSLTLIQANLAWEDKAANFEKFESLLAQAEDVGDLILLPEMFSTGFSMKPENLWDEPNGRGLHWMQTLADKYRAAVSGSLIIRENGNFYNRLYFVFPSGEFRTYDKKHLFTLAGEEKIYSAGANHLVVDYKGWKIMPLVCYDLRFPVWCRNIEEVDLQFYVANWPERRSEAWKTLLKARSIENMCFVAGLNRVGNDGNDVHHSGDSAVYSEVGEPLLQLTPSNEEVKTVELDRERILESRKRFQFLADRDKFQLTD